MVGVPPNSGANGVPQFTLSSKPVGRQYWKGKPVLPKIFLGKGFKEITLSLNLQHGIRKAGDVLEIFNNLNVNTPFTMSWNKQTIKDVQTLAQVLHVYKIAKVKSLNISIFRDVHQILESLTISSPEKSELIARHLIYWHKL